MLYSIVSDIPGRLRLKCAAGVMDAAEARGVTYALMRREGIRRAEVHPANGSIVVFFEPSVKEQVLNYVDSLDILELPREEEPSFESFATSVEIAAENNRFQHEIVSMLAWRFINWALMPEPVKVVYGIYRALGVIGEGLKHLLKKELTVEVLDATAMVASLSRGSFTEASSVAFLLHLSSILERHVQSRTHLALKQGLIVRPEKVWAVIDGQDVQIGIDEVQEEQILHIGAGSVLPVDGVVITGEGAVDEASLTGEAALVHKDEGSSAYAGCALEEGDLLVKVVARPGHARIDQIVALVEDSSELKAQLQGKAERLSDSLVPINLLAFFGIWAVSGSVERAMATLMVDYSCAIRLSTPVAILSAMDEAARQSIIVKGGKYLEAFSQADTIVFDKTGTLTHASPTLERVLCFGALSEDEVLRYAACIEEHFPHSMARAIVAAAEERGLAHGNELHAEVEYVVAHGIATKIAGERVIIGSAHFVFEDEGVAVPAKLQELLDKEAPTSSIVYLAMGKELVGALCISDPVRSEAKAVLQKLRGLGIEHIVMLTGDTERSAAHVSAELGIDSYHAQVLPEDKSSYVNDLKEKGHTVIMVGDGINDSPALAAAHVSVALSDATDLARAVADVAIQDCSLDSLVVLRTLSQRLMSRVKWDYNAIVSLNSLLIGLGVAQVISLTTAAYLHNALTISIAAANTRALLKA